MENSAYACWVMDPSVTGIQRGARVIAAELTTVDHLRAAVREVAGSADAEFQLLSVRFDQLTTLAKELYEPFEMPQGRERRFSVGGEKYPTFTQAIVAWADGPGGGRVSGRGLYGLLCGDTHPKALAARLNWRQGGRPIVAEHLVKVDYVERVCTAALSPFYGALICLASYHGWLGNRPLAEFEAAYERIAPDVFLDGDARGGA